MLQFGIAVILAGAALIVGGMFYEPTIPAGGVTGSLLGNRTYNIGLIAIQGFIVQVGIGLVISGSIFTAAGVLVERISIITSGLSGVQQKTATSSPASMPPAGTGAEDRMTFSQIERRFVPSTPGVEAAPAPKSQKTDTEEMRAWFAMTHGKTITAEEANGLIVARNAGNLLTAAKRLREKLS